MNWLEVVIWAFKIAVVIGALGTVVLGWDLWKENRKKINPKY